MIWLRTISLRRCCRGNHPAIRGNPTKSGWHVKATGVTLRQAATWQLEVELMPAFQVRSSQRDKQTDRDRVSSVAKVIDAAIASAMNERAALALRVKNAQDLAALAVGNDSDEYLSREPEDTKRLVDYEQQLIAGHMRIAELDTQIAGLNAVRNVCLTQFPDQGAG